MNTIKKIMITLPEAKEILEELDQEEADQIQKRSLDYVGKFSKTSAEQAREARRLLVEECGLQEDEAAQLVNIMPTTVEEIRVFTAGWKKLLPTENVQKILKILREHGQAASPRR